MLSLLKELGFYTALGLWAIAGLIVMIMDYWS